MKTLITFAALVVPVLSACGLGIGPKSVDKRSTAQDLTGITAVRVDGTDGDVALVPAVGNEGVVEFIKRTPKVTLGGPGGCRGSHSVEGTTLVVKIEKDASASCEIDAHLTIPAAATVAVKVGNGDVSLKGLQGALDISTKNGDIDAVLAAPSADQAALNAAFSTNNGDATIKSNFSPASGTLRASTNDGDIKIRLPQGTVLRIDETHDNGDFRTAFPSTADAAFTVDLKSNDGDLKIETN
jgi:hypothetical protein